MQSLLRQIESMVSAAMAAAFGDQAAGADPLVRTSTDAKLGDYQSNVAMGLAKKLGMKPRDAAAAIVAALPPSTPDLLEAPEIAGPGFINFRLKTAALNSAMGSIPAAPAGGEDRLGIDPVDASNKQTVVLDYSSPNVAKQMHVGHLRTTVIGDVFARVLAFQGHDVIRQNHLGDWGTQFGMVILGMWHAAMARHRGEPPGYLPRAVAELRAAIEAGSEAKLAYLKKVAERSKSEYEADQDGQRVFEPFLHACRAEALLTLVDIEAGYLYINTLTKEAAGTPYAAVLKDPRDVAQMMQRGGQQDAQERLAREIAIEITLRDCNAVYQKLGVLLADGDVCGESFYEPLLKGVMDEVIASLQSSDTQTGPIRAVCRRDQGALCVFLTKPDGSPAFKGPQGDPLPMIIQKSDGATLYATTDLAAILYRVAHPQRNPVRLRSPALVDTLARPPFHGGLGADRVIYVVGAPQKLHFEMLFPTAHAMGWTHRPQGEVRLEHVAFGSVLGADKKMLRTRSGDSVKLKDLLEEAVQRAEALVRQSEADPDRRRGLGESEIKDIAETIGVASVKYADLCQNRNTDYVFSWDKMMALQGNTAPYMLYACARIRSIHRKAVETRAGVPETATMRLDHPAERALALRILQLAEIVDAVGETLLPNILCDYLFDLAGRFMSFYESCPVLQAEDDATYASRLRLCELTHRALTIGLGLLGIRTLERM